MNEKDDYGFVLFDAGTSFKRDLDVESNPKFTLKIFAPMAIGALWSISNHAHMCYLHLHFSGSHSPLKS